MMPNRYILEVSHVNGFVAEFASFRIRIMVKHMVNYKIPEAKRQNLGQDVRMDAVFAALSYSTRRGMLNRLSKGPASIGELGRPYSISKPAITKHVKVLERAGLLHRHKDGRVHRCAMNPEPMADVVDWIEKTRDFWEQSLDALGQYLQQTDTKPKER